MYRRITVQAAQGIKRHPVWKIINDERTWGVAHMVELLPSKLTEEIFNIIFVHVNLYTQH
jgi:hypothetical protein